MKTRFPSILGVFAAILMVASFVVPANIAAPSAVSADPGIMKWDTVSTPNSVAGKNDVLNKYSPWGTDKGSEILDMAVGNDGMTVAFITRTWLSAAQGDPVTTQTGYHNRFMLSGTSGISTGASRYSALARNTQWQARMTATDIPELFQVTLAPDDPKFVAVTSSDPTITTGQSTDGPILIWVSTDGGQNWDLAFDGTALNATETIREIDISIDYGGKRDIGFVTVDSTCTDGRFFVRSSTGFTTWEPQLNANGVVPPAASGLNYYALKFSPTYNGDASVALVYADTTATYFNVALRDLNQNATLSYAYGAPGIEVKDPTSVAGASPDYMLLRNVGLQLPSDFSGQSSSLRRAYISLDVLTKTATAEAGIYRVDDTTIYELMDTTNIALKDIYSIAYFGTYASGKLLAGERLGFPCTATVPTWFTDSPTTCPIPCWYPALKPTTGAAGNQGTCAVGNQSGVGAAIVGWNADGSLGLVATGSRPVHEVPYTVSAIDGWFGDQLEDAIPDDESAFGISRNNGETWNQISLIDTRIDWFNDVAVAPDCTTIYLTSVNRNNGTGCNQFDSVWRSTINPNVAAPLPAVPPLGTVWERVYTRVTSGSCAIAQSDLPIIRVVNSCTDKKDGEIVGWAAQLASATTGGTGGVMAWSPDFGDYWASITPRDTVQDFAFESSTVLYTISPGALVQRLPYTGTAWSTNLPSYDTTLLFGHTIVAVPEGKVLTGMARGAAYITSYSATKGESWVTNTNAITGHGNEHVIFDVDFKNNQFIYVGDDAAGGTLGTVYRNTYPSFTKWVDNDMMSVANGASGISWPTGLDNPPHPLGIFGIAQAWTGDPQPALYAAHDNITYSHGLGWGSSVCRTLKPRDGMPKPGISWDCLDIFAPLNTTGVMFTLEPTSLKYCGCCSLDTNTTLYAIDDESGNTPRWNSLAYGNSAARTGRFDNHKNNSALMWDPLFPGYTPAYNQGMLWAYTDCLAKKGPILKSPADKYLIGADPVTGRNQQVDLAWEQLCLATGYELQVAKDKDFTLRINPAVNSAGTISAVTGSILLDMDSTNMTSPAAWIAPGALPEAGAIYYWRIRVYKSATSQLARSPWSEARSFTVKAGFIVNTPYYGVQLLSPNNGCLGCKVKPASFSWSPWKDATKYQIDLAKDPEFKQLVVTATTTTTGYEYNGTLDYSTNYFWRVKALEVNGQNIPSDWSATFSFQTESAPAAAAAPPEAPATPLWVWVIIAIGAILVIVTLILIFKTRRV